MINSINICTCDKCRRPISYGDVYYISYGTDDRGDITAKLCMRCLSDYDKSVSHFTETWLKGYIGNINFPNSHH